MQKFKTYVENLSFEIRFEHGHTYLDRCGQTLIDIEESCPGWLAGEVVPTGGKLQNEAKRASALFNSYQLGIAFQRPKRGLTDCVRDVEDLWSIIRRNLGLEALIRCGVRVQYFRPTASTTDAEKLIARSSLGIQVPDRLRSAGYDPVVRQPLVVLKREGDDYRVMLQGVTLSHGRSPSALLTADPRTLRRGQRKERATLERERSLYSNKPRFGVFLDVDCARYDIPRSPPFAVSELVRGFLETTTKEFLPLLEDLG